MKKKLNCIMLIDDDSEDNRFHQIIIEEMGITDKICFAQNGLEALEYFSQDNPIPELIFLDINMPKMNGWEFLEEYSKLGVSQKARVIIMMLTTSLNPADKERAIKIQEITGFETKPLTEEMLTHILETHFSD
jgi:CheY-like chemotaxis protein